MFSSHSFWWFKEEMCPHFTISPHWNILSQLVVLLGKLRRQSLAGACMSLVVSSECWQVPSTSSYVLSASCLQMRMWTLSLLGTSWHHGCDTSASFPTMTYYSSPSRTVKSKSTPLSYQLPWSCCTQLATATGKIMKTLLFSDPSNSSKRILSGDTLGLMSRLKWNVSSEASILLKTMLQISLQKVACVKHIRW